MRLAPLAAPIACLALLAASTPLQHPNFTGAYKLDRAASRADSIGPGTDYYERGVIRIEHREPTFVLRRDFVRDGRPDTAVVTLTSDGRPTVVGSGERRESLSLTWAGDTLVVSNGETGRGAASAVTVRFTLLDGGRTLEMRQRVSNPRQSYETVWILRRTR